SELVNEAAVPWKLACTLAGMCRSATVLSTALMAAPSASFDVKSNDTVIAGNWPWCMIANGSVVFSKWEKALSGTALLRAELVAPAEPEPRAIPLLDGLAASA